MNDVGESGVAERADPAGVELADSGSGSSAAPVSAPGPRHAAAPPQGPIRTLYAAAAASPIFWTILPISLIVSVGLETALALSLKYLIDAAIVPANAPVLNSLVLALVLGLLVAVLT